MTLYIVRHALAVPKKQWAGNDDDRPLNKRGLAQSKVLLKWSAGIGLNSILSSPARRCVDSVVEIAAAHDVSVVARGELAIGDVRAAKGLAAELMAEDLDVLICTHGEIVLPILRGLRPTVTSGKLSIAAKGSVWTLTRNKRGILASYATNTSLSRSDAPRRS